MCGVGLDHAVKYTTYEYKVETIPFTILLFNSLTVLVAFILRFCSSNSVVERSSYWKMPSQFMLTEIYIYMKGWDYPDIWLRGLWMIAERMAEEEETWSNDLTDEQPIFKKNFTISIKIKIKLYLLIGGSHERLKVSSVNHEAYTIPPATDLNMPIWLYRWACALQLKRK